MADNRGLRHAGKEPEELSEDDPLAELARIAGEFAPSQAKVAGESEKPSHDEAFEFDLEAELLRSFGVEQPVAAAAADNDEPADLPAFLRRRPSSEETEGEPALSSVPAAEAEPTSEMPAGEPVAELVPEPEPVAATGGEGRAPEILEEWTDLPAWPAHRPNTAARGREDAPDPSLGTFTADRHAETAEPVAEDFSAAEPSSPEAFAAPDDRAWAESVPTNEDVDAAASSYEPVESAAEDVPEVYDDEHFAYTEEMPADQPVGQDSHVGAITAAEEEFVAQELAIAGEPVENDYRAEVPAAPVPQAEEWDVQAADEEQYARAETPVAEDERLASAAVDDDPVWQDFERYAVPERADQAPAPQEPEPDNQWDIADELERAFAQFEDFRAAPAATAAPVVAPAPVAEAHQERPEAAWQGAGEPAAAEFAPPAPEPVPAEIETFEPEFEIETLPEEPADVASVQDDSLEIDFDFEDLELEMQAAAEEDLLHSEPLDEAIAEIEATSENTFEAAPEPAAFEPVAEYEPAFEPPYEESAYQAVAPIPTIDLDWPPVTDIPSAPAAPAAVAPPARDDLVFDVHDVADTTAMVEPVGEIDIPELPVDEDPAARETVDPDLSDLEAEFAEILAAEPAAPADEAPTEVDQPAPEKPFANGHDKIADTVIDFTQYDFSDLGRRQPEFGTAQHEPEIADDSPYDPMEDDLYYEDVGHDDARPVAAAAPKRKWIISGGAGVLLCGVALATFLLTGGDVVGNGEPPVIAASEEPFKIVPEDRGGRSVPNQDQAVYQQVAGAESGEAANLVSRSEQPVDVVQRTLDPQVLPLEGRPDPDTLAMVAPGEEPALAPAEDAAVAEELMADAPEPSADVAPERFGLEPRRVETLVVRADGTLVPAGSVEQEPAAAPATAAEAPTPSERPEGLAPSDPEARLQSAGEADDVSAPVRSVQTTTLTPGASPTAGAPAQGESVEQAALADPAASAGGLVGGEGALNNPGGYVMQIASQPSEQGARETYQNLLARYGSILGGRQAQIQAAEIPDRGTYYRVRVAGGTRDEAVALCEQYQAAGGSCFVAR